MDLDDVVELCEELDYALECTDPSWASKAMMDAFRAQRAADLCRLELKDCRLRVMMDRFSGNGIPDDDPLWQFIVCGHR
jgi:hypothetical protein